MKKIFYFSILLTTFISYSQTRPFNTSFPTPSKEEPETIVIDKDYVYNKQVRDTAFRQLLFNDLNFLILGDESPQKGISYEYAKDKSSLKLSGYLGKISQSFLTVDGDFKTDEGLFFFNDGDLGGTQAKVTLNFFFLSDLFFNNNRRFPELINKNNELSEKRAGASILTDYTKIDFVIDLYVKYEALFNLLEKTNYPYKETYKKKVKKLKSKLVELGIDPTTIKHSYDTKDYVNKEEYQTQIRSNFEDNSDEDNPQQDKIDFVSNQLDISKIVSEVKDVESKIDSIDHKLIKLELDINKDVWNSKHLFYFGVSPYYERQSKEFFNSKLENDTLTYAFDNLKRDVYGVNLNYNYFRQSKSNYFSRSYFRANIEFARSSNYSDLTLSTIRKEDPLGTGENQEALYKIKDKKAYTGDMPFEYSFKAGLSIDAYVWLKEDFGVFGNIGYNKFNFDTNTLDKETVPLRAGLMLDINRADKKGKIAVIQAFIDRRDITVAPDGENEELRFGFKIGIPINVKSSL